MAANLVKAGHDVVGFDVVPAALDAAAAAGIEIAPSGADAATSADIVITMLPSGRHVLDAYNGAGGASGLLVAARPGLRAPGAWDGFELAVRAILGQQITVTAARSLAAKLVDAYGERIEEAKQKVPVEAFESGLPQVGWGVELQGPDGQRVNAMVTEVAKEYVVLDFNHPLAGQDLTFDLELVKIVKE